MKFIKENWKYLVMGVGFGFMLLYFFSPRTEEIEVPVKIKVPVPVIEKEFDTIYVPKPVPVIVKGDTVKEIDSTYYNKFIQLKDSIKRDSLFREAVTINTYKEKVEDDTLTINLNMRVRGKLLNYQVGYKTKPRFIDLDTVLKVPVPTKTKVFLGGGFRMPINQLNPQGVAPVPFVGGYIKTKGDNLIFIEADKTNFSVGYAFKLKFGKKK